MKSIKIFVCLLLLAGCFQAQAQSRKSSASEVRRSEQRIAPKIRGEETVITRRSNAALSTAPESDVAWRRVVYKELDLNNDSNATLYYPEDAISGQQNLFRIILNTVADGKLAAYDYLDGREIFTDEFLVDVPSLLNKFYIPYTTSGSARYEIDPLDVPANEILSYYIIEQWEFNNVSSSTKASVLALCPVLHRAGDFGSETLKYPMFWVTMEDLRPFLANTAVFIDETDISPRYSLNDYFDMNLYSGEIYKTRNLRNKTLQQLYPDDAARRHAADSIQQSLENFDGKLWVPSREEVLAAREARQSKDAALGEIPARKDTPHPQRRSTRSSRGSTPKNTGNQAITRSVRDRK